MMPVILINRMLGPCRWPAAVSWALWAFAFDPRGDRLFVTGKNWPTLFEFRLRRAGEVARLGSSAR
jgi:hypothetical protein